jgi:hypothetical protein
MTLEHTADAAPFIAGYKYERYCRSCKKAVPTTADLACGDCGSELYDDEHGHGCPRCSDGQMSLKHSKVF